MQEALMDNVFDFRARFAMICYGIGDFEANKKEFLEALPTRLQFYEDWLASRKWLIGDTLFVGDSLF